MTESSGDPFSAAGGSGSSGQPSLPPANRPSTMRLEELEAAWPKLWIGYALSLATFVGEMIAFSRHPELAQAKGFPVPPLEMFLPAFVTRVFWFVCVFQYHKILAKIPGYKHPITPGKAVGFHFLPLFQFFGFFIGLTSSLNL